MARKKTTSDQAGAAPVSGHFSPSLFHRHLMDLHPPAMTFQGEALKPWQNRLRKKVKSLVGWPAEEPVALKPRTLWRRDHPLGVIEKVVFTSEPFCDVTAFVCLPRDVKPPYRWMICLQGHTTGAHVSIAVDRDDNEKPIAVEGDRDFGLGCMRRGVAALCIEQRSFGERRELVQEKVSQHGCHDAAMHGMMLGRSLLGQRVYDVQRGLDYLSTRDDVDMTRVGVMGNSGGGTISLFAAALLPGIGFAMPSCYFCTFRDSLMSIYHCSDNYVPGLMPVAEMADVMGLFAPKPVVLVAGKDDPIFPVKAVRKSFAHLKQIYAAAGAEGNCQLVVGPQGHRFYADLAWPKMLKVMNGLK